MGHQSCSLLRSGEVSIIWDMSEDENDIDQIPDALNAYKSLSPIFRAKNSRRFEAMVMLGKSGVS
jgi:hypothetical protein